MQIEGPFSWDQLIIEADGEEYDPFNEEELHDAWLRMATNSGKTSDRTCSSVAMTPLSRSSSVGPLPRLEEVWDSTLDTPLAPITNDASTANSPLFRRVDKPVPPSRLQECITDCIASSQVSRQDLFSKLDTELDLDTNIPDNLGCFDRLTGLIDDSLLADVQTPSQLRTVVEEVDAEIVDDDVMDDLFDGIVGADFGIGYTQACFGEKIPVDLDIGCTQGLLEEKTPVDLCIQCTQGSLEEKMPVSEAPSAMFSIGFSTARGGVIPPPSKEHLAKAIQLIEVDDSNSNHPTTSDFDLPRPSSLFKNVELNVSTLHTPCRDGGFAPDTLVTGTSSFTGTPGCSKENVESTPNIPAFVGFASATGKKLSAPSAASLKKAAALFKDVDKEFGGGSEVKQHLQVENAPKEEPTPMITKAEPALIPVSVGFASASGKKSIAPTESALKKARVMFDNIEREIQPEVQTTIPALKEKKGTLDMDRLSKKHSEPKTSAPMFSNLKTVATKTLGNSRRSSTSVGRPSIRSSISPSLNKRVSFMTSKDEEKVKVDPMKYFDLAIPENRVQLKDLCLNGAVSCENINAVVDRDRIFTMFMGKGPNPNCADKRWVMNHIDLIWWKVASTMTHFFDRKFYGDLSLEKIIVEQLLYRYEREVNMTQRSILKKISEGDALPTGLFVFLIKDINHERKELLLSDGWYSLWTHIDREIVRLIDERKLRVGMKIEATNIRLLKMEETAILDAEDSGFKLIVSYNSIRPCRWHQKLGKKRAISFRRPLKFVRRDGGVISYIEVVVTKRYPDIISVGWTDGKLTEVSRHEWEKMERSHFEEGENRPCKITKSIRLEVVDPFCGTKASVKLVEVSEEMTEKLVEGRVINLRECKPSGTDASSLEFRVFKSPQHCILLGMNLDLVPPKPDITKLHGLTSGKEYDVALRIVRCIQGEKHLWGINSGGDLISIDLGRFAPTLPKFTDRELAVFLNLEYKSKDMRLNIEVFSLGVVSDWDRKAGQTLNIDLDDHVFDKANRYIDGILAGSFTNG